MACIRNVTSYQSYPLHQGWELVSTAAGCYQNPAQLEQHAQAWLTASVPGTVIETLQQHHQWNLAHPLNVDSLDWWYRCSFAAVDVVEGTQRVLKLAGLATDATIWLNDQQILATDNMFRSYEVDITALLMEQNTLYIHFHSLQSLLTMKRPRPRWRTRLVEHQQLRWLRTTLLGRMPGWSPPLRPVGPWRTIVLEDRMLFALDQTSLQTTVEDGNGRVSVMFHAQCLLDVIPTHASLILDATEYALTVQKESDTAFTVRGEIEIPAVQLWWPHTHGAQPLYPARVVLHYPTTHAEIDCGKLAFRHIEWLADPLTHFGLRINDVPIFCRGACWTPLDMATLSGTAQEYTMALQLALRAGLNMFRVGGTMVYEDDAFYDLCDKAGILVWQDFMFANMDYPFAKEDFLTNCLQECEQVLTRLQTHACLAIWCGNSEISQQVAMLGLPAEMWHNDFFETTLPVLCQRYSHAPYWSSSPDGGALPFQANAGNAHYQGVGAFLRPLEDARRSEVHFAVECLAFANIPEDKTIDLFIKPEEMAIHHPKWKARVPRDAGAPWDFEDVRDYYLKLLFGLDPLKLRYSDMPRYMDLSRVVPGEVMAAVFAEWRRQRSVNNGGLIWFYRDLWPGAGWGIVDATGYPKASYYYLRRTWLPRACFFSDEGLNGLWVHVTNDQAEVFHAKLQLALYNASGTLMATVTREVRVSPHGGSELHVDALFEQFLDLTYVYRFGPPGYAFAVATLQRKEDAVVVSEAFYFVQGLPTEREINSGLSAQGSLQADGTYTLTVRADKLAQSVAIHTKSYLPEDNYFHLKPHGERVLTLYPLEKSVPLRGYVTALNTSHEVNIQV
ncbi:glycoside hydrolase family 2 protein [Dictyobacter arantiisoli]|uniref:beta-mannosidase n=1 Tax=Dictyobacter arantiisoli TaxID=2014874 RepID=A0A5A5TAL7_9CHLR|nr:glycoside hydrolase family 2 protein [Dictyobacter arantiisoli]GCF08029.1 beta-mannosidase [Dictyobacter arantiisoli]